MYSSGQVGGVPRDGGGALLLRGDGPREDVGEVHAQPAARHARRRAEPALLALPGASPR